METDKREPIVKDTVQLESEFLKRKITVDFYLPVQLDITPALLLINDGQDMEKLGLEKILDELYSSDEIYPVFCACIHAGVDRKMEYGTASTVDYKGRGSRAKLYTSFIFQELIPYIRQNYYPQGFSEKAFAGFSLGALSALDISWNNPIEFSKVGIFSGSLWWRTRDKNDRKYNDDTDRIMHQQIRHGDYFPWLKFFFECGAADEEGDRNNNGVIDSIDDTLDLIKELVDKGYDKEKDIYYLQLDDGKHDVATWARAMPVFLKWGWGRNNVEM